MAQTKNHTFKYVKSYDFKTVRIDGIFGSVNVKGEVNIGFYIDTLDVPKSTVHVVDTIGRIGAAIPSEPPTSSSREIPFAVNLDLNLAKQTVIWLNERIKEIEERQIKQK
jgi:hypothetical protein